MNLIRIREVGTHPMADYDVAIIGAGHNALVCAGYLAKAGYKIIVVERRPVVGGAVVTEEIVPGYKFDLGGSAHILIHHTPIVADLQLELYGLSYIDLDPLFFSPFPDGSHLTIWKDLSQTCDSIAAISPEDADAYYRFVREWEPLAEGMVQSFMEPPTASNLFRNLIWKTRTQKSSMVALSDILRGYGQLLRRTFKDPRVQALIGWMAAQSGPPPTEPISAPFALWHPMYHRSGIKRPRGGSGMLTQALARMIRAHGGDIITGAPVESILTSGGKAVGIETTGGIRVTARAIVSGAHLHTTMAMVEQKLLKEESQQLLARTRIGNGFGMVVRYAMHALPNYTAVPSPVGGKPASHHRALQFICPSLDYLDAAYGDYLAGRPSQDPALIAMTFSAVDPTLAPDGKHVLFLWGQYYPYQLAGGQQWAQISERESNRMLNKLAEYAPNVREAVIDKLVEDPIYLERELGLLRGNVMHLEMSIDQMFMMRPALTMSNYRGPLPALYLTGASTHPGGGIMGAAGRNAATVIMHDFERHKL
jgi:phytoene dehydrogenase-like protein